MCCEINKSDVYDSLSHENVQRNNDGELKYWCTDHSLFSQQVNEVLEKQSWTRGGLWQNNDGWYDTKTKYWEKKLDQEWTLAK